MALPKLYEQITWVNDTTPALNEDNLNAMSQALDDIDDRVIDLAGTIMEDVPQIIEDMATVEAGLETVGQAVTDAQNAASAAEGSSTTAGNNALVSEGWAKGTQNGIPVGSSSPYYHNNSEYFKDQARSFTPTGYQELVDDVSELNEALSDEVSARAELGAHNLLNVEGSYTKPASATNMVVAISDKGKIVTITDSDSATYRNIAYLVSLNKNTDYVIEGSASVTSGDARVKIETTTGTQIAITSSLSGTFKLAFNSGNNEQLKIVLFTSFSTASASNVTYNSLVLKLATDSNSAWTPYAMTNKELTDNKANKSDLASISITGTTNSTGSTISAGTYFYLNGALVKAKTSIANGATLTANTNYVEVTAGGLNELAVSKYDDDWLHLRKQGHLVNLYFEAATFNEDGKTFTKTIPAEFRPEQDFFYQFGVCFNGSAYVNTKMVVKKSDGTIVLGDNYSNPIQNLQPLYFSGRNTLYYGT